MKPLLLLAVALPSIAAARIGETVEQCAKRYGEPAEVTKGKLTAMHTYDCGPVIVTCSFFRGTCTAITYTPILKDRIEGKLGAFTAKQAQDLMRANGGSTKWERAGGADYSPIYRTEDGKLVGRSSDAGVAIQTTEDIARREALLTPESIGKAIEGF